MQRRKVTKTQSLFCLPYKRKWHIATPVFALLICFSLPGRLFDTPYATVITDRDNNLLGLHIAEDGQCFNPRLLKY